MTFTPEPPSRQTSHFQPHKCWDSKKHYVTGMLLIPSNTLNIGACCVKLATRWHWKFNLTLKLVIQGKRYFKAGFINKGAEFHRKIIYLCINCTDIVDDLLYFILWKQESTSNDTNWTNVCFLSLIIKWFSVYFRFFYCHFSFTNWNYLTLTVCYRSTTDVTQGQFVSICLLFFS